MQITPYEAIEIVAARTLKNTQDIRQKNKQRRYSVVDMYGVEYTRQGDGGSPAQIYVSISPDMVYLHRFEFKLIIQPFVSTITGATQSAEVQLHSTSLSTEEASGAGSHSHAITPNPHKHTTYPHSHNVVNGISMTHTTANDFRVKIEGVDITPFLAAQYDEWIDGEGIYPSRDIGKDYDILEVASDLRAQGRISDAEKLVSSGYKLVEISSSSPFQVTLVNYLKYSHLNR